VCVCVCVCVCGRQAAGCVGSYAMNDVGPSSLAELDRTEDGTHA